MSVFTIQVPDGRKLKIEAADEATAIKGAQEWVGGNPPVQNPAIRAATPIANGAAPNRQESVLPGLLGQFQNTSNAAQAGFNQGMTLGFGDEIYSGATAPFRAAISALQGNGFDIGKAYNDELATVRETNRDQAALNPGANVAGEITGALVGPGKGGSLLKDAVTGALYGAGTSDGDLKDRAIGAVTGGVVGGTLGKLIPGVFRAGGNAVEKAAQNRVTNVAIENAPGAADLASTASKMFQSSKSAGVGVTPQRFGSFARNLARQAHAADIDKDLDSGAWKVYERMVELAQEGFQNPNALSLSRLHNLRQKAQDVAMEFGAKNRTKTFAQNMIDGLDNMIHTLKPSEMTGPANLLGNGKNAGNTLLDAIGTWSRAKKVGLLETAIDKAGNYASGLESGLRLQFKSILNGKSAKLFTPAEREAMQRVINGTLPVKALRTLGMFKGMGGAVLGSLFGGAGGPVGAAAGAAIGGALGAGGRLITEKSTEAAANRAAKIVSTPNIPRVALPNPLARIPGAPFALPVIDQTRRPLEITIRGSGK